MEWVTIRGGRKAHRACLESHNAAISCGQDSGDCGNPACAFSRAVALSKEDAIARVFPGTYDGEVTRRYIAKHGLAATAAKVLEANDKLRYAGLSEEEVAAHLQKIHP